MRHKHTDGSDRRFALSDDLADRRHGGHHHRHHRSQQHGRHGGGRTADNGPIHFLVLAAIAEQPRVGYEVMAVIEERSGGSERPDPAMIYPTLSWFEDIGFAAVDTDDAGRRRYRITGDGEAFLAASRASAEAMFAGAGGADRAGPGLRGMDRLTRAVRARLGRGPLAVEAIRAALDAATRDVEHG